MNRIFLSSHGRLASGMKDSVEILLGETHTITVFDAYIDQSSVQEHIEAFFQTVNEGDQVFLLSDLYGGSVNQVMFRYLDRPNTTLITGINLSFLLDLVSRDEISAGDLDEMIETSRQMLRIVRLEEDKEGEGGFF